jgi:hypothetical protein
MSNYAKQIQIEEQEYNNSKNKKTELINPLVKSSFIITNILLLTTGLITFIEALRVENSLIRHLFNLETSISLVGGYFYSIFISKIYEYEKEDKPIDWDTITLTRYIDWTITTPLMLLVLCIFLSMESKTVIHLSTFVLIMIFNYLMLYIGYLGETKVLDRFTACIGGFISFFITFYLIFSNFVIIKKGIKKYWLLLFYLFTWMMYGLVYLLEENNKNIAFNILDCISKCLVGIGLWIYYIKIIPKL